MKKRTVIYRDGLIFIAVLSVVFLGAFIRQVNLLLLFASILACFPFFDFWLGRRLIRDLTVSRVSPSKVSAGNPFFVTLTITNPNRRRPVWGIVAEDTVALESPENGLSSLETTEKNVFKDEAASLAADSRSSRKESSRPRGDNTEITDISRWESKKEKGLLRRKKKIYRPAVYFEESRGGESVRKEWAGQLPLRGRYRLGPITLSTRFPLGFFRNSIDCDVPGELIVYPKIGKIAPEWFAGNRFRNDEKAALRREIARTGDEIAGIRAWQTGDARKWIHWRSTAKHQELMVRQFQSQEDSSAVVILDLYQLPEERDSLTGKENTERAVSFAAALWSELTRSASGNIFFGLLAAEKKTHQDAPASPTFLQCSATSPIARSVFERLATAQPTEKDSLAQIFAKAAVTVKTSATLILITTRPFSKNASDRLPISEMSGGSSRLFQKMNVVDSSSPEFDKIYQI